MNCKLVPFNITERILVRGRRPCGIFFCLHGPRSVKLTAIWETDRNTILFYSSSGERVVKTQLVQAPVLRAGPSLSIHHPISSPVNHPHESPPSCWYSPANNRSASD